MKQSAQLSIHIQDPAGNPVSKAVVRLLNLSDGSGYEAVSTHQPGNFALSDLIPGEYALRVSDPSDSFQTEERQISIASGGNSAMVFVGQADDSFYYAGEVKVYFQREEESFLLLTTGERAREVTRTVLSQLNLGINESLQKLISADHPTDLSFVAVSLPDNQRVELAGQLMTSVTGRMREQGLQTTLALAIRRGEQMLQGLTNELIVRFEPEVTETEIAQLADKYGLSIVRPLPYAGNAFLFVQPGTPGYKLLEIAHQLKQNHPVIYTEPNLLFQLINHAIVPNDQHWGTQKDLCLINCDDAWDTTIGSPNITIAVFDFDGVSPTHEDLTDNLSDGSPKMVTSYNFRVDPPVPQTDAALGGSHGTQCAGIATANINNGTGPVKKGIVGVAPDCRLIGVRIPAVTSFTKLADTFRWAAGLPTTSPGFPPAPSRPADVISNSWGPGLTTAMTQMVMADCFDDLTTQGRAGRGCVLAFSAGNKGNIAFDDPASGDYNAFAADPRTIAVGASINKMPTAPRVVDTHAPYSQPGMALDIVAPSSSTTTKIIPIIDPTTTTGLPAPATYSSSFGGTSHACATIAGVAALILSVNPGLRWEDVREILRSTAIKIDPGNGDPVGQWSVDGAGNPLFSRWYGYGRVDADLAVRKAFSPILIRDNLGDTGTIPSSGWYANSPDIWVRRTDDPVPPVLPDIGDFLHENPVRGQNNYVYCRVKNISPATITNVKVRAMITHYPGMEFQYPTHFTPGDPATTPVGTWLIGEQVIPSLNAGETQIVKIPWSASLIPPAVVGGTTWHPCLLAEVFPNSGTFVPAGTPATPLDIQRFRQIAQKNITIVDPPRPRSLPGGTPAPFPDGRPDSFVGIMAGTADLVGISHLVIDRSLLPDQFPVQIRIADPTLMKSLLAWVDKVNRGELTGREKSHGLRLLTEARLAIECCEDQRIVMTAPPGTRIEWECGPAPQLPELRIQTHQGMEVLEIGPSHNPVELPLRLAGSQLVPLMVAIPTDFQGRGGELRLNQRRGDGYLSAGYTVRFS